MKRLLLALVVFALYLAHQDIWNWRTPYPLVFGFIPIGLFYHACFTVASALVMWLLVTYAWPAHLEAEVAEVERPQGQETGKAKKEDAR
jgi:hypothetical protein